MATYLQEHGGAPLDHPRRCTADTQAGKPCRRYAIRGGTVCRVHGGAAPQVKAKARQRLDEAADRMARELLNIATGAESEAVKLAAVRDALDRAGLKPPAQVELSAKPPEPWEELLGDVMHVTKQQHEAWKRGEYSPAPAEPPALPPAREDIVDAELVEDAPAVPPDSTGDRADRSAAPEWAEPPPASRTGQLVPLEDALAAVAQANRTAEVSHTRRKRR
jgi:hypothetical protein